MLVKLAGPQSFHWLLCLYADWERSTLYSSCSKNEHYPFLWKTHMNTAYTTRYEKWCGTTVDWQPLFQTPLLNSSIEFIWKTFIEMSTCNYHFHGIFIWFLNELTLSAKLTHDCSLCGLLISLHICLSHPQCVPDLTWGSHGQAASCSKKRRVRFPTLRLQTELLP